VNLVVRRITIAVLAAALAGAVLAVPALSKDGPQAIASKKAKKKCKKGKKGKKKRKGCKGGGPSGSGAGLPGQATPSSPTPPDPPTNPPTLTVSAVSVAANPVLAGNATTGQVTVDGAAPSGGQPVDLQSSNPSRVSVPASVVVAPGQTSASFPVATTVGAPLTATLTGSIGASNASTQLNVVDTASVTSLKLARQCFTFGSFGSNRVTLDVPAPSDTLVSLVSSDPLALQVPSGVTVPSGSTSAFFSADAIGASPLVTVTATLGSSNASDTAPVSATDPATEAEAATLNPDAVRQGDGSTGTLTLTCEAPPGGTPVTFSSSDPSSVGVPTAGTVTVPAGELSVDFPITTSLDAGDGQYVISVTAGGVTVQATLTVSSSLPT
jgi:hypothetical protein